MKRTTRMALTVIAAVLAAACATQSAGPVQTLRGADAAEADKVFAETAWIGSSPGSQKGYARTYSTQPPLIPHSVEYLDEMTLQDNRCLGCHGPASAAAANAPALTAKHFVEGSTTQVSQARYACLMCHVPQADAKPLVENTFEGDRQLPAASRR